MDPTLLTPHPGLSASHGRKPTRSHSLAHGSGKCPVAIGGRHLGPLRCWVNLLLAQAKPGSLRSQWRSKWRSNGEGRARAAGRDFLLSSCFCFISARSSALRNILPNILVFKGHRSPCSPVRFIYYNCVNTLPPFTTQCCLSEPPFSGCVNGLEVKETVFLWSRPELETPVLWVRELH